MKLNGLHVERFGIWQGLRLEGLDPGASCFYGPNEAGKTTLLQFVRSMLYGFGPDRRHYLPANSEGEAGGSLFTASPLGDFEICRRLTAETSVPYGKLDVVAADGSRHSGPQLKSLLANVDERIFNNVFAISLDELQELATLSDTEAADLLYTIAAGLDRVSLVDVLGEVTKSRTRLLSPDGQACQVAQLQADRARISAELDACLEQGRHFGRLASDRSQCEAEIARLEADAEQLEDQAVCLQRAAAVREPWSRREELDRQLTDLPVLQVPEGAVATLEALHAAAVARKKKLAAAQQAARRAAGEAASIVLNRGLLRSAARIEALSEQQTWLKTNLDQIARLDSEKAALEGQLSAAWQRLSPGQSPPGGGRQAMSSQRLRAFMPVARQVRAATEQVREAEAAAQAARDAQRALAERIAAGLTALGERDLAAATQRLGEEIARLRKRAQLDEQIEEMERCREELEQQSGASLDRQFLPMWAVLALGGLFTCGVLLIVAGLILPLGQTSAVGWALALLGLAGTFAAGVTKVMVERSWTLKQDEGQKQLSVVESQLAQARQERAAIDQRLSRGGGPIAVRLQKAEEKLGGLEALLPLDGQRQAAQEEAEHADQRIAEAKAELASARQRWKQTARAQGLPETIALGDIRRAVKSSGRLDKVQTRLGEIDGQTAQLRAQVSAVSSRVEQVIAAAGVQLAIAEPLVALAALQQMATQQRAAYDVQKQARRAERIAEHRAARLKNSLRRIGRRRRQLLESAGARSLAELRDAAKRCDEVRTLRAEREQLDRQVAGILGDDVPADAIARLLGSHLPEQLSAIEIDVQSRLQALRGRIRQLSEQNGMLAEKMRVLAEDRRAEQLRFELATIDQRLRDVFERWRVLAVTDHMLDSIRTSYEHERQPETLKEASRYFKLLTSDRYERVWTPLGERTLRVDNAEGRDRPVEQLSRGTREQLFLALRLALAASYHRRGAALPMLLDDVLVNFDTERAGAAIAVLRDFAASGRQVLVFTCHEHIYQMFQAAGLTAVCLPSGGRPIPKPIAPPAPALPPPPEQPEPVREPPKRPRRVRAVKEPPSVPPPAPPEAPAAADLAEDVPPWEEVMYSEIDDEPAPAELPVEENLWYDSADDELPKTE